MARSLRLAHITHEPAAYTVQLCFILDTNRSESDLSHVRLKPSYREPRIQAAYCETVLTPEEGMVSVTFDVVRRNGTPRVAQGAAL